VGVRATGSSSQIILQVLVSLALIIGGANLFVTEIEHISTALGIAPLVLALALAPLASELPEKLNSVLWVRRGKDSLALGNITGAMVFQSSIPIAIGMVFVDWHLQGPAIIAMVCALVGGALALVNVRITGRFSAPWVLVWLALYGGAVAYIFVTG
jgi:cation:H+ antiporter